MYIINKDHPVIAILNTQTPVILVGYTDKNDVYDDLKNVTRHSVKYE